MKKTTKPTSKCRCAAVLTIRKADKLTPQGRKDLAAWLRDQAKWILATDPKFLASTFRARYLY